jgi:sulfite reductase alpha subunit
MVWLGTTTDELEPIFKEMTEQGWDIGGSGSDTRTPSCCNGPARCEWACYDTLNLCYETTMRYQDEIHRPQWPYKLKFKFAGCPNDCVASIARSDISVIGTWRDDIRVDQAEVGKYIDGGLDVVQDVLMNCPTKCISMNGKEMAIDNSNCVRCMHCINVMPKALRPGTDKGVTICIGAKAPIVTGALLGSVIVPFMKLEPPYEEFYDFCDRFTEFWEENGENRERIGELMQRVGLGNYLEEVEVDPIPEMIGAPRDNPYVFYDEYYEEDE